MKKLLLILVLAGSSMYGRSNVYVQFGISVGGPGGYVMAPGPPPPPMRYVQPRNPGRGYVWVPGYWYPAGRNYRWRDGYYAKPPRGNARWNAPRYRDNRYYGGYWR